MEKALVNRTLLFESLMFGLTITDVRKLAFDVADKNQIPHNFNKETRLSGKKRLTHLRLVMLSTAFE